jgi:restriction endonuclease Mrr
VGLIPNKTQVGDKGIDGRIFPVGAEPRGPGEGELQLSERWYPIQAKQKDKTGRPDIDAFETAMRRAKSEKGFFVSFGYSEDATTEISRFFREEHRVIVPFTVRDILDEQIAQKLA